MYQRFRLEDVATPMKWGFLADNIVALLRSAGSGQSMPSEAQDFARGAVEFLDMTLRGIDNFGRYRFDRDIGEVVESLTIYNYATEAFPDVAADKAKLKEQISKLADACRRWQEGSPLEETERAGLEQFFSAIARVTLREAHSILHPPVTPEPRWLLTKNSVSH